MGFTTIPSSGAKFRASTLSSLITEVRPVVARKTIDETVNNSNTLQNDDELFVVVAANTTYHFDLVFLYNTGATPDIKFAWTFPTGLTMRYSLVGAATTFQNFYQLQTSVAALDGIGAASAASASGIVVVTNAGTLQLQWAQNTANASNTLVLAGSELQLRKIG